MIAVAGSGTELELSTETRSRPDVSPPTISRSRRTLAVYGREPSTRNGCIQNPRAPVPNNVISRKPPWFPPVAWYDGVDAVPQESKVQFPLKSIPLFTVCPDWMPWIPGTMRVGLTASPAKSVTAKTMNAMIANVHRTERTGRMLEGGGRAAQAPIGRPHRGQKFPLNKVPHRGQGQPAGLGGAAKDGADAMAGVPHRGQKRPSNNAPQRTHCIPPRRGARAI